MADRVRQPMDGRRVSGIPLAEVPVPVATEPPNPELQQDQADSQVPQFPEGFVVVDRQSGIKVWDVRSGDFVDAADLETDPQGTTKMSGNIIVAGGSIASDNFTEGSAGWEITHDGNAEFNNVALRGQLVGEDGANQLANGNAETPVDAEWYSSSDDLSADATHVHGGASAFMLSNTGGGTRYLLRRDGFEGGPGSLFNSASLIPVTPGSVWRASCWVYVAESGQTGNMSLPTYQSDGTFVQNMVGASLGLAANDWTRLTMAFVIPDNVAWLGFDVSATATGTNSVWFDDITVSPATVITAGLIETSDGPERVEIITGNGGNHINVYTGDVREVNPGGLSVDVEFQSTVVPVLDLSAPQFNSDPSADQAYLMLTGQSADGTTQRSKAELVGHVVSIGDATTGSEVDIQGDLAVSGVANIPPTGSIIAFAGATPPAGYLRCDGSAVSRTTYAALFTVCGTTYGAGNGSTTFNIPDLTGRVAVGFNNDLTVLDPRTPVTRGVAGGEAAHTLTTAEMPVHSHTHSKTIGTGSGGNVASGGINGQIDNGGAQHATSNAGGGGSHNNMMPYLGINYIIKT